VFSAQPPSNAGVRFPVPLPGVPRREMSSPHIGFPRKMCSVQNPTDRCIRNGTACRPVSRHSLHRRPLPSCSAVRSNPALFQPARIQRAGDPGDLGATVAHHLIGQADLADAVRGRVVPKPVVISIPEKLFENPLGFVQALLALTRKFPVARGIRQGHSGCERRQPYTRYVAPDTLPSHTS
jgi:hypothetical protein